MKNMCVNNFIDNFHEICLIPKNLLTLATNDK